MTLSAKDRIGTYSILVSFAALYVESLPRSRTGLIALIALSELAAIWPVISVFPAKWRGEITNKRFLRLSRVPLAPVVVGAIASALFHAHPDFEPRTGLVLAIVGAISAFCFIVFVGKGSGLWPQRWSWITSLAHFTVAFGYLVLKVDVGFTLRLALLYATYGLTTHYSVALVLSEEIPTPSLPEVS